MGSRPTSSRVRRSPSVKCCSGDCRSNFWGCWLQRRWRQRRLWGTSPPRPRYQSVRYVKPQLLFSFTCLTRKRKKKHPASHGSIALTAAPNPPSRSAPMSGGGTSRLNLSQHHPGQTLHLQEPRPQKGGLRLPHTQVFRERQLCSYQHHRNGMRGRASLDSGHIHRVLCHIHHTDRHIHIRQDGHQDCRNLNLVVG